MSMLLLHSSKHLVTVLYQAGGIGREELMLKIFLGGLYFFIEPLSIFTEKKTPWRFDSTILLQELQAITSCKLKFLFPD